MAVTMVSVGDGVELCAETFGDPGDPAVLLVTGATSSMESWEPAFCRALADAGRLRDPLRPSRHRGVDDLAGRSAGVHRRRPLARSAAVARRDGHPGRALRRRLDGRGISQDLAVRFPDRVLSLTLVATSSAFERARPDAAAVDGTAGAQLRGAGDHAVDWPTRRRSWRRTSGCSASSPAVSGSTRTGSRRSPVGCSRAP